MPTQCNLYSVEQIDFAKQMSSELPRLQDVMEATAAMNRVQQVYQLEPADVANGLLDEVQLKCVSNGLIE